MTGADAASSALVAAERLAEQMARRWRAGDRRGVEIWLAEHPGVACSGQAVSRLIYEEMCLREEAGAEVSAGGFELRLPRWRAEIQALFACQRLLEDWPEQPRFPAPGESCAGFLILEELGQGGLGKVYRAREEFLAGRSVVLKLTPCAGEEHLTLARLQHTHIVPLYSARELPDRQLRLLCMPDLGGTTLDRLLAHLGGLPPARRDGAALCAALNHYPVPGPPPAASARRFLEGLCPARAVCWFGACLAEALHYAHSRGLVHLDLKPSNVLLTAEGQPMLLDFHLARQPLTAGTPSPLPLSLGGRGETTLSPLSPRGRGVGVRGVGGTPGRMSPEQIQALEACHDGRQIPLTVDGRSDLYSLGLLLREALGYQDPASVSAPRPPHIPFGLHDILLRCLAPDPARRYPSAEQLTKDLRRQLTNRPLRGVPNRSWSERWGKWRRRRPFALALLAMELAVAAAILALAGMTLTHSLQGKREARACLVRGRQLHALGRDAEAAQLFQDGLGHLGGKALHRGLKKELRRELREATRAHDAESLRRKIEDWRGCYDEGRLSPQHLRRLLADTEEARITVRSLLASETGADLVDGLRSDLRDLAILRGFLRVQAASAPARKEAHALALDELAEAEKWAGPGSLLLREAQLHAEALGQTERARRAAEQAERLEPRTSWECSGLGRWWLRRGDILRAAKTFARAVECYPRDFRAWWGVGLCAHRRGDWQEALSAFTVCLALAPERAECCYNRALTWTALGDLTRARADCDRALQLEPKLAAALLQRAALSLRQGRPAEATTDLERALSLGADPAAVHYNLALVHQAQGDTAAAERNAREALRCRPSYAEAQSLLRALRR